MVVSLCTTTFATYVGTTNFYTAGQFKILQRKLECAFYVMASDEDEGPIITMSIDPKFSNVRDCVKQHQRLILHMERIENLFSMILFVQTFGSVINLCFSGFQIVLGDSETTLLRLFFSVDFIIASSVNLFLYAWPCQEIIEESQEIATGAYGALWYCLPYTEEGRLCRQSMMIVIMRARKPCVLTVGKFTPMSLQTFGSVFNSALSYFTVLRQMNEEA
uniref:Olfactory receptor 36 n=1 Tax=Meteorus pulchricornis TaxID=51522 RepID=A0A1S5VFM5_9HYME|nr:olfactory receptor 36 [Meteorus pulchricornis]